MKSPKVNVIVGRFQIHEPHLAHQEILKFAAYSDFGIIFIGNSIVRDGKNPLDFITRKMMIESWLDKCEELDNKSIIVTGILDEGDDRKWVQKLDKAIDEIIPGSKEVEMISGPDGFGDIYSKFGGRHSVRIITTNFNTKAQKIREIVANRPVDSIDFRKGAIYHSENSFPHTISVVDIVAVDFKRDLVLVGTRPGSALYRFPGGFVDPDDTSLEQAASREFYEETGILIEDSKFKYLTSLPINDHRYRASSNKIISTIFTVEINAESIIASDPSGEEFSEFKFIPRGSDSLICIESTHQDIFKRIMVQQVDKYGA